MTWELALWACLWGMVLIMVTEMRQAILMTGPCPVTV